MPTQRRHRSSVACQKCRKRKVRCSVTVTGVPCIPCVQDGNECIVEVDSHTLPRSSLSTSAYNSSSGSTGRTRESVSASVSLATTPDRTLPSSVDHHTISSHNHARLPEPQNESSFFTHDAERLRDMEEEETGAEISIAARGQGRIDGGVPFYTGEQPGGVTAVVGAYCETPQEMPRHILIRSTPTIPMSQSDRGYLEQKGIFTLPQESSRRELLRAYFHHIHPTLPIINAAVLLDLDKSDPSDYQLSSILLFWSMAAAAVNFVPSNMWRTEGFASRKQMRDTMYSHAKCLYNIMDEADKEVLLQAALLLCFRNSDRDSHFHPWYWSGIAISLCQLIGLHRNPDDSRFNPMVSLHRRRMWRRLWASCLFRDRWLSLTLGRPMRIHMDDCDMPLPTVQDVMDDLSEIPSSLQEKYIPHDLRQQAEYWIVLIELSKLLGDVLTLCYQQRVTQPTLQQFDGMEAKLLQFQIPDLPCSANSRLTTFYYYHVQLHYRATLITFYRTFTLTTPRDLLPTVEEAWQNRVRSQLEATAMYTNNVLDGIAREELVGLAGPMTPPLLVPAMQVHLLNCTSPNLLTRQLGFNKLDFCMEVMRELQKSYTSASIFRGIFREAIRQLSLRQMDGANFEDTNEWRTSSTAPRDDHESAYPSDNAAMESLINDDVLESLLNENSTYDFWESLNIPEQSIYSSGI